MASMRAVQVTGPGGPFELVERDIPEPGPGAVRIRVEACGICHSDAFTKDGAWPGIKYPRVPGHEVAGVIDALGPEVPGWKRGQRVGVGWHGGHCGYCDSCRRGDFVTCRNAALVPGISYDGGYADYMIAPAGALAAIPDPLSAVEAAPLMCAGITTYNSLRHSGARPGDLVAVLGLGGLGHLGVQFAARMGFDTVAVARRDDEEGLARQLGARRYINGAKQDAAAELAKLGGAKVILATAPSGKAMSAVVGGLSVDGRLIVLGAAPDPMTVAAGGLISGRRSIVGWPSGRSIDSQDTMAFSVLTGVRSMNEVFPLEQAAAAYDRMISGDARFRVVLTTGAAERAAAGRA
jgi:D-arabinose 1-dehydrogenase-like Zn-dependent alcohol dehydrogenase